MKKYLAILLLTLLCVTGVLTACNNVASTETAIRWGKYDAEGNAVADAYSYKISPLFIWNYWSKRNERCSFNGCYCLYETLCIK